MVLWNASCSILCHIGAIRFSFSFFAALPTSICSSDNLCEQNCVSLDGTEVCSCDVGFTLAENNASCLDVNECNASPAICDQLCNNTNGSFVCECIGGFDLHPDGRTCIGNIYIYTHI